MVPDVRRRSS